MPKKIPPVVHDYMAAVGREGGKAAGRSMTKEQRAERARKAAAGRWKKDGGKPRKK